MGEHWRFRCSPIVYPPRIRVLPTTQRESGVLRVHSKLGDFAAQQLLLHIAPVLDSQQIEILLAKATARMRTLELQAVLDLFGQEDHTILEKPIRHRFLARFTVGIGTNFHVGEFLDGVIIEEEPPSIAPPSVIAGIQILVEYIGGGIVANALPQTDHDGAGRIIVRALKENRQRYDFQLHDEHAKINAVLIYLHATGGLAADLVQQRRVEHAAVQAQVEVHDVVQHAAGPIDLVHHAVFVGNRRHSREGAPLVGAGRLIADDFQMIRAGVERESERDGSRHPGGPLQSVAAADLLGDLVQYGDLADVIETDGGIVMAERPARHQAEEEYARLVVQPGRHMKIRERGTEQIVNVGDAMKHGIGVDPIGAVQQGNDERHHAVVGQDPASDDEGAAVAEKAGIDDVERERWRRVGRAVQQGLDPFENSLRVAFQILERNGELGDAQRAAQQLRVDATSDLQPVLRRCQRVGAQLAGLREGVRDRSPEPVPDVASYRVREAEGDVGVVAIDDHGHEEMVQRVPDAGFRGERGKHREDLRPVLCDVAAVQPQAFLADSDRRVRIHGFEGTLRPMRVLAQLTVEIIVDGQYQPSRRADAGLVVCACLEAGISLQGG